MLLPRTLLSLYTGNVWERLVAVGRGNPRLVDTFGHRWLTERGARDQAEWVGVRRRRQCQGQRGARHRRRDGK
ncbi:MAG TPA: hypothetical protein VFA16_19135 [Mycobacterium sp.]|nr:hypothetical protein [Mycobacterium sp.]